MNELRLEGERVYLRRIAMSDATPEYARWLNDPDTTRYMESGRHEETIKSLRQYIVKYENRNDVLFLAVVLKDGDRHIGNVKLEPVNKVHNNALLGIMIGDADARGKGYGSEAILLTLQHAFDVLGLHRVALGVTADNERAIKCYENLGFREEGRLRENVNRQSHYVDGVWMGMLEQEFREKYG
ncbi:MAG: GNAT family N-acetyltransferase [Verrucomicrobia bacterium]|nr:GNAT family N-acetyltransferase [Verrucomicrobiota bacterium]